ncbi:hypothetical protein [Sinobaca sp. H24]|uniref:hypothetical protein n=1 Tax=Sinobaca sp. H24 TaxID=2923376 RepID=UPI00207979D1|nr:hypothetical protein [Sinobaca sp. H24]
MIRNTRMKLGNRTSLKENGSHPAENTERHNDTAGVEAEHSSKDTASSNPQKELNHCSATLVFG